MANPEVIKDALKLIFKGIKILEEGCKGKRKFTIDGRLVGDIGEVLVEGDYDIKELCKGNNPVYDAITSDDKKVQIKASFQKHLTFKSIPDKEKPVYYIGIKIEKNGTYKEIYNGPCSLIENRFKDRKNIKTKAIPISIKILEELQKKVVETEKIRKRS